MSIQVYFMLAGLAVFHCVAQDGDAPDCQKSRSESEYYTAAVVEYAPFEMRAEEDPPLVMRKNALNHMYYMEKAAKKGVDIVVFPECGLTGIDLPTSRKELRPYLTEIPEPNQKPNPCVDATGNTSQLLKDLSCASRRYAIYSVINLPEMAPCATQDGVNTSCPDDGVFIYNTNIVFDRAGVIVARYRKYNLFIEPGFDIEPTAGHSTFDTDFGVRFGMFICFDILFHQPALAMVIEQNITDIVYSTAWFSELPFLTAVQTQAAWSYATNTNFLASGYNKPANMNTGSGIYAGIDGVVTSVMSSDRVDQMLVAKVKKKKNKSNTGERETASHDTRTKREDNEGDRKDSFVKNAQSQGSQECSVLNEDLSGHLFSGSPLKQQRQDEKSSKQSDDFIQHTREYENKKEYGEIRNIVKRNVLFAGGVEQPADSVSSVKKHRRPFESELHLFTTTLLNLTKADDEGNHNETLSLCHLSLCCNFTFNTRSGVYGVETNRIDREFYRAGVFDGSELAYSYQTCLIMRCIGPDLASCGQDIEQPKSLTSSTVFAEININGHFKKGGKINTGHNNNNFYLNENVSINKQHLAMSNNQQIQNLSTFCLYVDGFPNDRYVNLLPYGHLNLYQDDLSHYNTLLIDSQNVNKQLDLCHGSLCCQFYIGAETEINSSSNEIPVKNSQYTSNNGYYFRIGVFEGVRTFVLKIEAGLQVCAVFACTTDNITTCGLLRNQTKTHVDIEVLQTSQATRSVLDVGSNDERMSVDEVLLLKSVEIKGYFDKENLIMPNTVTSKLLPFNGFDFEFSSESEQVSHIYRSKTFATMNANGTAVDDMLTFGIYARDFRKDVA